MGRVARLGIIVNDLSRSRLAWVGAWVMAHTLTRNRFTRHDAPLSVRRAYLPAEAWALILTAGHVPVQTRVRVVPASLRHRRHTRRVARRHRSRRAAVTDERTEVAVVGGGPAGASIAIRLARAGHAVVLLERDPVWRWRAGGVFASPAAVTALRPARHDALRHRGGVPADPGDARRDAGRRRRSA